MSSWKLALTPWIPRSQFQGVTSDGRPSENALQDCGECCVSMILEYWYPGYIIPPDEIKDHILGQSILGTTNAQQLVSALMWFGGLSARILTPVGMQGDGSLLRTEWTALDQGLPIITLRCWISDAGVVYPTIGHWCCVVGMDNTTVTVSDPWTGALRTEPYLTHYQRSKQLLVGVTL